MTQAEHQLHLVEAETEHERVKFEAWRISEIRRLIPGIEGDSDHRIKDTLLRWDEFTGRYLTISEQNRWETWQACCIARATPVQLPRLENRPR